MFDEFIAPRIARESAELHMLKTHKIPHAIRMKNYARLATLSDSALACQRAIAELESLRGAPDWQITTYMASL